MEIYAGFLEHTDHQVGRLIDALEDLEVLDDTLIYYIIGDNGASAEGTLNGCFNEMVTLNGMPGIETADSCVSKIDDFGTPEPTTTTRWAGRTRCARRTSGPSRSPRTGAAPATAPSCTGPNGITAQGRVRAPVPPRHRRRQDRPGGGRTARAGDGERHRAGPAGGRQHAADASTTADAPETHDVQYFEMFGNRGIYHQGWTAVTKHRTPWTADPPPPFDDDVWELYGPDDWTQANDLAAENPEKLAELQRLWLIEADKYNVLPLDDRALRADQPRPGRPAAADPRQHPAAVRRDAGDARAPS